jgi:uncharacterized protein YkwD
MRTAFFVLIIGVGLIVVVFLTTRQVFRPRFALTTTPTVTTISASTSISSPPAELTPTMIALGVPTATPTAVALSPTAAASVPAADVPALQGLMLNLINQDRQANGLKPVLWDKIATLAGLAHADEMARFGYMSHWNLEGQGPDYRYSQAGGLNTVRENVFLYQHSLGTGPASRGDWEALIRKAQQSLMDSPGHRENILAREHTHVGLGIAYNADAGRLTIAQEFVDQYIALQPERRLIPVGEKVTISGRLMAGATMPVINLAYETYPKIMTIDALNATGTYTSPAETYQAIALKTNSDGQFSQPIVLDYKRQTGLYHIRVWVETDHGKTLASDVVVSVQ